MRKSTTKRAGGQNMNKPPLLPPSGRVPTKLPGLQPSQFTQKLNIQNSLTNLQEKESLQLKQSDYNPALRQSKDSFKSSIFHNKPLTSAKLSGRSIWADHGVAINDQTEIKSAVSATSATSGGLNQLVGSTGDLSSH